MASIVSSPTFKPLMSLSAIHRIVSEDGDEPVPHDRVLRGLARVLASSSFVKSNRLSRFLRFTVEQTIEGLENDLKEYTVGTIVYGRREDFDPSCDSIVRTEARRLRAKLQKYYEEEGKNDEVVIFFRPGTYVPIFRWGKSLGKHLRTEPRSTHDFGNLDDEIWVAVMPFQSVRNDSIAASFAFGLSEEILHRLVFIPGLRIIADAQYDRSTEERIEEPAPTSTAQLLLCGSVRSELRSLRVYARLKTAEGHVFWSQRFEAPAEHQALLDLQESVVSAFLSRLCERP